MAENYKDSGGDWWHSALCAETDPEAFFGATSNVVKAICNKCDVEDDCRTDRLKREAGLSKIEIFGYQGGITPTETVRRLGKLAR